LTINIDKGGKDVVNVLYEANTDDGWEQDHINLLKDLVGFLVLDGLRLVIRGGRG